MNHVFSVLVDEVAGSWKARCPAMEHLGAITGGETREEASTHIHGILRMILLDLEQQGLAIPTDDVLPDGIPVAVDTAAE